MRVFIYIHHAMTLIPPDSFTNASYLDSLGSLTIYGDPPITYNSSTHHIGVLAVSAGSSGVVNLLDQTLGAGHKTFTSTPRCAVAPTLPSDLANKGYVDTIGMGLAWQQEIKSFYDFTAGDPAGLTAGDRYIALASFGSFTINHIYAYNGIAYVETTPLEGYAAFVYSDTSPQYANQCIIYNGSAWVGMGTSLSHSSLIGLANDDHTQYWLNPGRAGAALTMRNTDVIAKFANISCEAATGNMVFTPSAGANFTFAVQGAQGIVAIASTVASSSTTTGALTVGGGLGVAGKVYIGGALNITNATGSTTPATGSGIFAGGIGCGDTLSVAGEVRAFDITAPKTAYTRLWHDGIISYFDCTASGRAFNFAPNFTLVAVSGNLASGAEIRCLDITTPFTQYGRMWRDGLITNMCSSVGSSTYQFSTNYTNVNVAGTTASSSKTTGALTVAGGLGVSGAINSGTSLATFDTTTPFAASFSIAHSNGTTTFDNSASTQTLNITTRYTKVAVQGTTASTTTSTGALVVAGGAGVAGQITAGGAFKTTIATASSSTITGSGIFAGGVGIAGKLYIGGDFNTASATDATSKTSASITTAGGIGSSKRIWALNMTCETAPVATTDVVRLTDLSPFANATVVPFPTYFNCTSGESTAAITLYLTKLGNMVMVSFNTVSGILTFPAGSGGHIITNDALTSTYSLASPVCCAFPALVGGTQGNVYITMGTDRKIYVYAGLNLTDFVQTTYLAIQPFTLVYYSS